MDDFRFDALWTLTITLVTVLVDWIASQLIFHSAGVRAIRRATDQAASDRARMNVIKEELERVSQRQAASKTWGAELAAVAFSLDIGILGLWIKRPDSFEFFDRWSGPGQDRDVQIWFLFLAIHFALLCTAIALKQLHAVKIEETAPDQRERSLGRLWLKQNKWMLANNGVGVITLLTSFVVINNSI